MKLHGKSGERRQRESRIKIMSKEEPLLEEEAEEIFIGEIFDEDIMRPTTNEERLWQAVIVQALVDATLPYNSVYRRQARAVLDTEVGVTADYMEDICELANLNPSFIKRVYKHLRTKKIRLMRKE